MQWYNDDGVKTDISTFSGNAWTCSPKLSWMFNWALPLVNQGVLAKVNTTKFVPGKPKFVPGFRGEHYDLHNTHFVSPHSSTLFLYFSLI
jgi:hypothetical protein